MSQPDVNVPPDLPLGPDERAMLEARISTLYRRIENLTVMRDEAVQSRNLAEFRAQRLQAALDLFKTGPKT